MNLLKHPIVYGLEWNEKYFSWIEMENKGGKWQVKNAASILNLKAFVNKNNHKDKPVILSVPRSTTFLLWSEMSDANPKNIHDKASALFPISIEELAWGTAALTINGNHKTIIFAGMTNNQLMIYKETIASAGLKLQGLGLNFSGQHAALKYFYSAKYTSETICLIDDDKSKPEMTVFKDGFPLLSRILTSRDDAQINKSLDHLKKSRGVLNPNIICLQKISPGFSLAAAGQIISLHKPNTLWIQAPVQHNRIYSKMWHRHKTNILAFASFTFMALGFYLNSNNQKKELVVMKLKRDLQGQTTEHKGRRFNSPQELMTEVIKRIPLKSHLVDLIIDFNQKTLTIKGRASNYSLVSNFLTELSQYPGWRDVHADKSNLIKVGDQQVVDYALQASLK